MCKAPLMTLKLDKIIIQVKSLVKQRGSLNCMSMCRLINCSTYTQYFQQMPTSKIFRHSSGFSE